MLFTIINTTSAGLLHTKGSAKNRKKKGKSKERKKRMDLQL